MNKFQEKKIIKKLRKGDEQAFQKIYDLYVDRMYRFVFLKVSLDEKAKEIVQDVFLKFWKVSCDDKSNIKNVSALLYRIARFTIIDYYRSQGYKADEVSIDEVAGVEQLIVKDETDKNIDIKYDLEKIRNALPKLPQIYQDVIVMKFVEEKTNKEIGQVLDKEEGNIGVLAHRAVNALRKIINEMGE